MREEMSSLSLLLWRHRRCKVVLCFKGLCGYEGTYVFKQSCLKPCN